MYILLNSMTENV